MKTDSLAGMVLKKRMLDLRNADRKESDVHYWEGNDSVLRKEDGCDSAVSHIPVRSSGASSISSLHSCLLPGLCHCHPLLSFNIWSLFSIPKTGAPTMTTLLKVLVSGLFFVFFSFGRLKALRTQLTNFPLI